MPAALGPIFVAGATAAIGYFFQNQSAKIANERQQREAELARAQKIFKEVSTSADSLGYHLRAAMYAALRKATDTSAEKFEKLDRATWISYERAQEAWMSSKTRFKAQVGRYFGDENRDRMEKLQERFSRAKTVVEATYYDTGRNSVVKQGKEDSKQRNKYFLLIDEIEELLLELSEQMIRQVQRQTVGRLGRG